MASAQLVRWLPRQARPCHPPHLPQEFTSQPSPDSSRSTGAYCAYSATTFGVLEFISVGRRAAAERAVHGPQAKRTLLSSDGARRLVRRGAYANQSMLSERVQLIVRRTAYHFLGMKKHAAVLEELRL